MKNCFRSLLSPSFPGKFGGPDFTVRPANSKTLFELKFSPSILTDRRNEYITNLVFSVYAVSCGASFFLLGLKARASPLGYKSDWKKTSVCNLQYGLQTRLVTSILATETAGYSVIFSRLLSPHLLFVLVKNRAIIEIPSNDLFSSHAAIAELSKIDRK